MVVDVKIRIELVDELLVEIVVVVVVDDDLVVFAVVKEKLG